MNDWTDKNYVHYCQSTLHAKSKPNSIAVSYTKEICCQSKYCLTFQDRKIEFSCYRSWTAHAC
jgi:hypothetical protein